MEGRRRRRRYLRPPRRLKVPLPTLSLSIITTIDRVSFPPLDVATAVPARRLTAAVLLGRHLPSLFEDRRPQIYRRFPPSPLQSLIPLHLSPRASVNSLLSAADLMEGNLLSEKEGIWQWDPGIEIAGGGRKPISSPVDFILGCSVEVQLLLVWPVSTKKERVEGSIVTSGHRGVKNLKDAKSSISPSPSLAPNKSNWIWKSLAKCWFSSDLFRLFAYSRSPVVRVCSHGYGVSCSDDVLGLSFT